MYKVKNWDDFTNDYTLHEFETKADLCTFIGAMIDAPFCKYMMIVLREMTIHSANKDSIKGLFSFNTANFTVSNGNQKQYAPIELYRFGSEAEYKDFIND